MNSNSSSSSISSRLKRGTNIIAKNKKKTTISCTAVCPAFFLPLVSAAFFFISIVSNHCYRTQFLLFLFPPDFVRPRKLFRGSVHFWKYSTFCNRTSRLSFTIDVNSFLFYCLRFFMNFTKKKKRLKKKLGKSTWISTIFIDRNHIYMIYWFKTRRPITNTFIYVWYAHIFTDATIFFSSSS